MKRIGCLLAAAAFAAILTSAQAEEVVDVELVLAADVSYSMQADELEIQRRGYAEAISSAEVWSAIRGGLHQKIAVTYIEWAGDWQLRTIVPWTVIDGPDSALLVAREINANQQGAMRRTSIAGAIDVAAGMFEGNGIRGLKRVIDISGDGPNNQGRRVTAARDEAVNKGIIINGLPLMTRSTGFYTGFDLPDLDLYYTDCVIGGPGSFVLPVTAWDQFPAAVRRKLVLELMFDNSNYLPIVTVSSREPYDCLIGEKIWQQRRQYLDMQ